MTHEKPKPQRVAAAWHLAMAVLNFGALLYHLFASSEHLACARHGGRKKST